MIKTDADWNLESAIVQDQCAKFYGSGKQSNAQDRNRTISLENWTMLDQLKHNMKDDLSAEEEDLRDLIAMKKTTTSIFDSCNERPKTVGYKTKMQKLKEE